MSSRKKAEIYEPGLLMRLPPDEVRNTLLMSAGLLLSALILSGAGIVTPTFLSYGEYYRLGVLPLALGSFSIYFICLLIFSGIRPWRDVVLTLSLGLVSGGLYLMLVPYTGPVEVKFDVQLGIMQMAMGVFAIPLLLSGLRDADVEKREQTQRLLAISALILATFLSVSGVMSLTDLLHPATFDAVLFRFDQVLGFQASVVLAGYMNQIPWLKISAMASYKYLPLGFAILYALQFRYPSRRHVDLLGFWIISTVCVLIVYHLVPVSGPHYLFGSNFPFKLPALDKIPGVAVIIPPAPRNGVPSMHFGWAFGFWLASFWLRPLWIRAGFTVLLLLNVFATLATGEHYLLDLVVAIPFVVAVYALCLKGVCVATARRVAIQSAVLFALWLVFLRFGLSLAESAPWLLWGAITFTVGLAFVALRRLALSSADDVLMTENGAPPPRAKMVRELWLIAGLFVFSGFSGLVYEVVFAKSLALVFGSTAVATYTVLATYMGGMSIGAWIGGGLQEKIGRPLVAYAICEVAIGVYCALTPLFFPWMQSFYVAVAGGVDPSSQSLLFLRIGLGAVVLLFPTVLMGMTMPFLVRHFSDRQEQLGVSVAILYATNTLGAALGALLTGYLVIPALGIRGTTLLAAALNLLVALLAIKLFKRFGRAGDLRAVPRVVEGRVVEGCEAGSTTRKSLGWVALAVLTVGGGITLALETSYIHLLAVVAGNSAYAFALMLFTFLLGLSAGAIAVKRLLYRSLPLAELLSWLEYGLALVILLGVFSWEIIPGYFADYAYYPKVLSFAEREFIRGVVCWLAMFPPAVLIGAIYPVAMECVGQAFPERKVRMLGYAMALNTFGNIAGVILCGFWLLPMLGALNSIHVLAWTATLLAIIVAVAGKPRRKAWAFAPLPLVLLVFFGQPKEFDYTALASGANVYFAKQGFGDAIDHSESLDGGLTTVSVASDSDGHVIKTLLTNGKFQGNDAEQGEVKAQVGLALVPLLHSRERERALVIGYGTGMSARTLHDAGFGKMDIVELSADMMRMADQHFETVNKGVSKAPGVTVHVTDGRNFLLLNQASYDVVSMEISSIWFAGAASLYNREFYSLVKQRLKPEGVLQQWIQLHHLRTEDLVSVLATLRTEFRYVWFYYIGGQGILIASNSDRSVPDQRNVDTLNTTDSLRPLLSLYGDDARVLIDTVIASPDTIDRLLGSFGVASERLISSDNNLYLEYATPRGNALSSGASVNANLDFLRKFRKE